MAVAFLINSVLSQDLPNLAIFAKVIVALISFGQYFEYLRIEELQSRDAPDLNYGRCCCEAEVLTGDMRPRETRSKEWRGETVFMTPDPVQRTVCSAALSPHYTLHTPPGGCS